MKTNLSSDPQLLKKSKKGIVSHSNKFPFYSSLDSNVSIKREKIAQLNILELIYAEANREPNGSV